MAAGGEDGAAGVGALAGLRVLVAEDRGLIAAKVAETLRRAGCAVVGPAATLGAALELAARGEGGAPGAAVLDIDLRGEPVFPLAEALRARGVPFLFLTGYGPLVVPGPWRGTPRLEKPFDAPGLLGALGRVVAAGAAAPRPGAAADPAGEPPELVRGAWATIKRQRDLIMEARIRSAATASGVRPPREG